MMARVFKFLSRLIVNKNSFNSALIQTRKRSITTLLTTSNEEVDSISEAKKKVVRNVQSTLNVHMRNALKLVNDNKKLINTSSSFMSANFKILQENDLDSSIALKYPHLLWCSHLRAKIPILAELDLPLNNTIVLAGLSKSMLEKMVLYYKNSEDRIFVLSQLFEISPTETCEFLYKRPFVITINLDTIKKTVKILRDFGISPEDIRRDPWILRYSEKILRERISEIRNAEIEFLTPKPWMLRSPKEVIENYLKRRQDNREILGSASLTEYLSTKLDCTEDQAKYLVSKMPALRTKSLRTISDIINFLYSKGFQAHHIYRVPKILVHSVETTKKRLEKIENEGIKIDSLYMLTKSQTQFMKIFEAMLKAKRTI